MEFSEEYLNKKFAELATKDDLKSIRDDLKVFATKDDLKGLAKQESLDKLGTTVDKLAGKVDTLAATVDTVVATVANLHVDFQTLKTDMPSKELINNVYNAADRLGKLTQDYYIEHKTLQKKVNTMEPVVEQAASKLSLKY